jgi:RecA/RadA recombinase
MKPEIENFKTFLSQIPGVFWGSSAEALRGDVPEASAAEVASKGLGASGFGFRDEFPRGAIAQVFGTHGSGKTETVLRFLSGNASTQMTVWMEQEFTAYPAAFPQYGVSLESVFFIDFSEVRDFSQVLRVVQQAVGSRAFAVCVLNLSWDRHLRAEEQGTALRRIQLAAEKSETAVVLISERAAPSGGSWPIAMQVRVVRDSAGKPGLEFLKSKCHRPRPRPL